jgi:hypothetical protein
MRRVFLPALLVLHVSLVVLVYLLFCTRWGCPL